MKLTKGTPATFPELRGSLAALRWPCFAEIKYDGEATLIGYHKTAPVPIFTSNKYGTMRQEWSKLDEIMDILDNNDVERAVFLAELFFGEGKQGDLYQLLSHKDDDNLNLRIFDVGHLITSETQMQGEHTPLIQRKEMLGEIFQNTVYLPELKLVSNKVEAEQWFKMCTDAGYEGAVIKPLDGFLVHGPCNWVKMKFKDRSNYLVVDVSQTQERIEIQLPNPNMPKPGHVWAANIRVGVKVTNKHKRNLQPGDWVEIEHQGVLESGSLRHPVFIKKVEGEKE